MRRLSAEEQEDWARLAQSVRPIHPRTAPRLSPLVISNKPAQSQPAPPKIMAPKVKGRVPLDRAPVPAPKSPAPVIANTLDGSWDRRLGTGRAIPDQVIDLHGHSLDSAWSYLDHGLERAIRHHARTVLLITGKSRNAERVGNERRGIIRAKIGDWLAGSRFADRIAAVRNAHPRHGGDGALYVIMRRGRDG